MAKKEKQARTAPRRGTTTITGSGMFRKTVYFSPEEWEAIRRRAFEQNIAYTDIVREAVRRFLHVSSRPNLG